MNEPLPGQKTNFLAFLTVVAQGLKATGVVDPFYADVASQVLAVAMSVTLGLKARRHMKGA